MTCGFAIWFAMALFKYWWNNDNYNEIYLKSAPVVRLRVTTILAFWDGAILVQFNLWSISGLGSVDIIVCDFAKQLRPTL